MKLIPLLMLLIFSTINCQTEPPAQPEPIQYEIPPEPEKPAITFFAIEEGVGLTEEGAKTLSRYLADMRAYQKELLLIIEKQRADRE